MVVCLSVCSHVPSGLPQHGYGVAVGLLLDLHQAEIRALYGRFQTARSKKSEAQAQWDGVKNRFGVHTVWSILRLCKFVFLANRQEHLRLLWLLQTTSCSFASPCVRGHVVRAQHKRFLKHWGSDKGPRRRNGTRPASHVDGMDSGPYAHVQQTILTSSFEGLIDL